MTTSNPQFDRWSSEIIDSSRPAETEVIAGEWQARVSRLLRLIFREGAVAQLNRGYSLNQDDPVLRVRWLADHGFTAFRKASDHPYAALIHKLIQEMPGEDWGSVIDFVAAPIVSWLREAEAQHNAKETPS